MFGNWRRGLALGVLTLSLAACKVIPDGSGPVTTPTPTATETPTSQ